MTSERCPSCGGAVRPGAPWCTCCWADLRPKPPPPPPPPPPPVAVLPPPAVAAPAHPAGDLGWPGTAAEVPLGVAAASLLTTPGMLSAPSPLPGAPLPGLPVAAMPAAPFPAAPADPLGEPVAVAAPAVVTWPCVECGEANHIDLDRCGVCTAPFGGRIARLDDVKGARRRYMLMGIGAVVTFLLLLGAITFATTSASTVEDSVPDPALENPIDYSSLPTG